MTQHHQRQQVLSDQLPGVTEEEEQQEGGFPPRVLSPVAVFAQFPWVISPSRLPWAPAEGDAAGVLQVSAMQWPGWWWSSTFPEFFPGVV